MANANAPRGIIPYRKTTGAPYNGESNIYYVPADNATALYVGDPIAYVSNKGDSVGIPSVGIATAGGGAYILGAMVGRVIGGEPAVPVLQNDHVYVPALTAAYILVSDDPDILYWVQEDSVGGAMVQGAGNRNADLVAGTGSTTTGYSGWMLDSSTLQTTNTLQMRVVRGLEEADNTIASAFAKWLVRINLDALLNPTGV